MISMFISISPLLITALAAIFVMMGIAIKRCVLIAQTISVIGLIAALISLALIDVDAVQENRELLSYLSIDAFALFYMGLILVATLCVTLFSMPYFKAYSDHAEEFYLLMLLATVGALLLACANHFAPFFLGLELLSIPMYGLIAYTKAHSRSLEAGIKYLILSATASATLLFGMAILYAQFGTLSFSVVGILNELNTSVEITYLVLGGALMLIAIAFKLSVAPFHQWAPDVYEGAPAPVTIYLGSIAKVAMFAVAIRFVLLSNLLQISDRLFWIVAILAILSMLVGNILALKEKNYVRMLALSSVSHMGYALMALLCFELGPVNLYLLTYVVTSIAAFGVMSLLATPESHLGDERAFTGLFWRRPLLAITLSVMLLSLAGIPLTLGFMAKLFIVLEAAKSGYWILIAALIIGSGMSLYYYLGAIIRLFSKASTDAICTSASKCGVIIGINQLILVIIVIAITLFGLYPDPLLALSESAQIGVFL